MRNKCYDLIIWWLWTWYGMERGDFSQWPPFSLALSQCYLPTHNKTQGKGGAETAARCVQHLDRRCVSSVSRLPHCAVFKCNLLPFLLLKQVGVANANSRGVGVGMLQLLTIATQDCMTHACIRVLLRGGKHFSERKMSVFLLWHLLLARQSDVPGEAV